MKTIFNAVMILLLILCSSASADEKTHRLAAEELVKLMKSDQLLKPLLDQMRIIMDKQFAQMGVSEDDRPLMKKYTDKFVDTMEEQFGWDQIKEDIISVYVGTFTEDEIKGISAFYKSPSGQVYIDKMPLLIKKSMEITQQKLPDMMTIMQQNMSEMIEEIKSEKKSDQKKPKEI